MENSDDAASTVVDNQAIIEEVQAILNANPQSSDLITAGHFCRDPAFLSSFSTSVIASLPQILSCAPHERKSEQFSKASERALLLAVEQRSDECMQFSILMGSLAVYYIRPTFPMRGIVLSMFGRALREHWKWTNAVADLDDTIDFFRWTVELEPKEEPNRAFHFDDLGCALLERFKLHHHDVDFISGKQAFDDAIAMGHSSEPLFLSNLGQLVLEKFSSSPENQTESQTEDLDESIRLHETALLRVTDGYRGTTGVLHYFLGQAYDKRYQLLKDETDWQKAKEAFEKAMKSIPRAAPNYFFYVCNLARYYSVHSTNFRTLEDSAKSEALYREALELRPGELKVMAALGEGLRFQAALKHSRSSLDEAIGLLSKAVDQTPDDDLEMAFRRIALASAFAQRFEVTLSREDLDRAIQVCRDAIKSEVLEDLRKAQALNQLSQYLVLKLKVGGNHNDLEEALLTALSASSIKTISGKEQAHCCWTCSKIYHELYKRSLEEAHLNSALDWIQKAIDLDDGFRDSVYLYYNEFGNILSSKFDRTGALGDLRFCIEKYHLAFEDRKKAGVPRDRHLEAMVNQGLGMAQTKLFVFSAQITDLNLAIARLQNAVEDTDLSEAVYSNRVANLSLAFSLRGDVTQKVDDFIKAKQCIELALVHAELLPPGRAVYLESRLGIAHLRSFHVSKKLEDVEAAITAFERIKASSRADEGLVRESLANLALSLLMKAGATKTITDLGAAMLVYDQAFTSSSCDPQAMLHLSRTLSDTGYQIYRHNRLPRLGGVAMLASEVVLRNPTASPGHRVHHLMLLGRMEIEVKGNAIAAMGRLQEAISVLPTSLLAGSSRIDQLRFMRQFFWLPGYVVSISLMAGQGVDQAIRLSECSRGFIWKSIIHDQEDISSLEQAHPELAGELKKFNTKFALEPKKKAFDQLDYSIPLSRFDTLDSGVSYTRLLKTIRSQPGFEGFMIMPGDSSNFNSYASEGPVVIINATKFRSDAILITTNGTKAISLPELSYKDLISNKSKLVAALLTLNKLEENSSNDFNEVMRWLWDVAAEPILSNLGLIRLASDALNLGSRPRVWWLVNETITPFPMHAAGRYCDGSRVGLCTAVIDCVTSSYIPTLGALTFARKRQHGMEKLGRQAERGSLVQMSETPDLSPLEHASAEITSVRSVLECSGIPCEILAEPKKRQVLQHLQQCDIVHFACHGVVDNDDPSLSRLLLQDWSTQPLNVRTLMNATVDKCRLAFLSGCHTAATPTLGLNQESLSLAGGFLMAGVPMTIATLWQIDDAIGTKAASLFYEGLMVDGHLDWDRAAQALSSALRTLKEGGTNAILWAAYIHLGA